MAPSKKQNATNLLVVARQAMVSGDIAYAIAAFEKAHQAQPSNPDILMELAEAQLQYNLVQESVVSLTQALACSPNHRLAGQRLAELLGHHRLSSATGVNPFGLQAALQQPEIDHESIVRLAFQYLATQTPLAQALEAAKSDPRSIARSLVLHSTAKILGNSLLHVALSTGINRLPDLEKLLTHIRAVLLLELAHDRFEDKSLITFIIALILQCWNNQHVFAVTAEEKQRLANMSLDVGSVLQASRTPDCIRNVLVCLLYRSLDDLRLEGSKDQWLKLRPKALANAFANRIEEEETLTKIAATIPSLMLASQSKDHVTSAVAQHYENYPYPRWVSYQQPQNSTPFAGLEGYFDEASLGFMTEAYDVLIAGAGTGQHAAASTARYGANARILALDLSRSSLAYGQMQAERLGLKNLEFLQADINALDGLDRTFNIIEAVGVLHHMRDPFAGWASLIKKLRPGGMMWIGLYSALSRKNIHDLRSAPGFPGSNASNDEVRAYRAHLMTLPENHPASRLLRSEDFYSLNDFRDLVLNAHEMPLRLPEIETFMKDQGLEFKGFMMHPLIWEYYVKRFPEAEWPGTLESWWVFEQENPSLFSAMYRFWCHKPL